MPTAKELYEWCIDKGEYGMSRSVYEAAHHFNISIEEANRLYEEGRYGTGD